MEDIRVSKDVRLPAGYSEYRIDSIRNLELSFTATKDAQVFIRVNACKSLRIRAFIPKNVEVSILYWNDCKDKLVSDESYEVLGNGNLHVAYGECNNADTERKAYVALREQGARALLSSASLVHGFKDYSMQVVNFAPHTYGDMKNYAVVMKTGKLLIDAVGKIVKGASGSESHQTSRALSFEDGQKSEILPELLIDEDDVQASHAMSIGRVDEDQLYYMMSRGLSVQQCTSLISTGYLMPIADTIDNEKLKEDLHEELGRKLSEL